MRIENWWPLLDPPTRQWLINNNGDVVPPTILAQISAVAGQPTTEASWGDESTPEGFFLSDEAVDWIEETANSADSDED